MKAIAPFLFALLALFNHLRAQDEIVEDASHPEAEFHVAINPTDTNNIVLATIHGFAEVDSGNYIMVYYTFDFGQSWQTSSFHGFHGADNNLAGDPVVAFDAQGKAYIVNLTLGNEFSIVTLLSTSDDGGATWSEASQVVDFSDKPWLAVDAHPSSPHQGNIYVPVVTFGPELYVLDQSFQITSPVVVPEGDHLPSAAVRKDGELFVGTVGISDPNEVYISQYTNGGTDHVHSTLVASFPDFTYNAPDVSHRFQPTAYLAIDNSGGPFDGRIYVSYTASESGNSTYFDVFLTYSDDEGLTWSTPTPVHSDQTTDEHQFYSSLYVNPSGVLILDWYDRRHFDNSNKITDFYMGISYDGGNSFTEVQLNSEPMDFDIMIPIGGFFGIGEYHQLVATEYTAVSFWADGRTNDGDINIYMAKVFLDNPLAGVQEWAVLSEKISVSNVYPLPVGKSANTDITLKASRSLRYDLLGVDGKILAQHGWQTYPPGQHTLSVSTAHLTSGSYLLRIASDIGWFKTIRFVK